MIRTAVRLAMILIDLALLRIAYAALIGGAFIWTLVGRAVHRR
jgi:hypothetical protein